ncbi:uncharacterized protein A4U43_C09F15010 [Asparagus officinalis]|uniref:Uncharacterized protein n=1 Tax=Asparagus officinalis TaxID=4686 RepID=A0A5P1E7T4_ASPOF|nr:uncharacterized protein A4U43_C09F15010 [Asparagus officinalis]
MVETRRSSASSSSNKRNPKLSKVRSFPLLWIRLIFEIRLKVLIDLFRRGRQRSVFKTAGVIDESTEFAAEEAGEVAEGISTESPRSSAMADASSRDHTQPIPDDHVIIQLYFSDITEYFILEGISTESPRSSAMADASSRDHTQPIPDDHVIIQLLSLEPQYCSDDPFNMISVVDQHASTPDETCGQSDPDHN